MGRRKQNTDADLLARARQRLMGVSTSGPVRNDQSFETNIVNLIDWEQFAEDILQIKPEQRVNAYLRLMEFAIGKKQSVSGETQEREKDAAEQLVDAMMRENQN